MRIVTPTLAILAAAAGLAATLAVPASAATARATAAQDCSKPESVAKMNNYGATVNGAAVDDVEGYHRVAPGQTLMMVLWGNLSEAVNGGKVKVALAKDGGDPAVEEGDLTKVFTDAQGNLLQFPVAAGAFSWYLPAKIREDAPAGRYIEVLEATNEAGRQVLCLAAGFQVDGPAAAPAPAPAG